MWRYMIPFFVLVALGLVFWRGLFLNPGEVPSPLIGKPAPEFSLPGLYDSQAGFSSDDLKGQVSLVNVFGSWCPGCHEEHATLMEFAASFDIPLYGLDWKDERDAAMRWLDSSGNPYTAIGFDQSGKVGINWGVYGAPETFIVDADGIVRMKHIGPLTPELIRRKILPMVEELRSANRASQSDPRSETPAGESVQ